MTTARDRYRAKLRTADQAAAMIPDGAFIVQGNAVGEPPALLDAVAARARAGSVTRLTMTSLLPLGASARSILAPDVRGIIHWRSIFASGVDRGSSPAATPSTRRPSSIRCRASTASS